MLRPSLAAGLGVAAVCGSVASVAIMSGGAHAATRVPVTGLPGFGQVVVDSAANRVFVSEGTNASSSVSKTPAQGIVVADLSGNYLTTIDAGTGAQGLTLGPDGQLYAALSIAGKVAQIDPATYSETDYPLPAGDAPEYLAAQSGKVWVSYQTGPSTGFIGEITPGTTSSFQDSGLTSPRWIDAPTLAADPSNGGTLVAVNPDLTPLTIASLDVSGVTPTVIADSGFFTTCSSAGWQVAVLPGGKQFTMACDNDMAASDPVFSTADLSVASSGYPTIAPGQAIALASDGAVATGGTADTYPWTGQPDVNVFSPGSTSPAQSYTEGDPNDWNVAPGGLAWGDSTVLAVVMAAPRANNTVPYNYQLRIITDPLLTQSALAMNFLEPEPLGTAISVSGSLTINGVAAAGKTVSISRSTPGGTPVQVGQATTDSSGNFTISDTPAAVGAYTYTAHFAGDSATAPDTATGTVSVLNAALITLQLPSAVTANHSFQISGALTINGAPAAGQTLTITRSTGGATTCPPTATATPTPVPTASLSGPPSASATPAPTISATPPGGSPSPCPSPSATATPSPSATHLSASGTPSPSLAPSPSGTSIPAPALTACPPLQSCGGTTVTVGQVVTDSNGAFTISDTPPAPGTYTYNVILFNTSIDAYATATGTVVAYPDQIVLQMPATALPNQPFDASGWLTFASGASASGKTVTITRANPDGTTTTITATTGTKGSFTFRDNPPADGAYTYTATYADSTGTVTAKTSATVTVAKES